MCNSLGQPISLLAELPWAGDGVSKQLLLCSPLVRVDPVSLRPSRLVQRRATERFGVVNKQIAGQKEASLYTSRQMVDRLRPLHPVTSDIYLSGGLRSRLVCINRVKIVKMDVRRMYR